jgi:hypothetical protein
MTNEITAEKKVFITRTSKIIMVPIWWWIGVILVVVTYLPRYDAHKEPSVFDIALSIEAEQLLYGKSTSYVCFNYFICFVGMVQVLCVIFLLFLVLF